MKTGEYIILGAAFAALAIGVTACARADESVTFVTDKAQVAECVYVGKVYNSASLFTVTPGMNDKAMINTAREIGADTILRRGKYDSKGEGFKCQK